MSKLLDLGRTLLLLPLMALAAVRVNAQSPPSTAPPDNLFRTIASLDSALFDSYNRCDLKKFKTFFTEDVEFYHDQSGLTVGAQTVAEQVKKTDRPSLVGKIQTLDKTKCSVSLSPPSGATSVPIAPFRLQLFAPV
jgi:hypothetical protein